MNASQKTIPLYEQPAMNAPTLGQVDLTAIATDDHVGNSLDEWRSSILDQAAAVLSDPSQPEFQKKVAIWEKSGLLPFPERKDMTITSNGCMVFDTRVSHYDVRYAVWIMVGEIRVGVKIPQTLIGTDTLRRKLSESYDGHACSKSVNVGQSVMFDWVFKDNFADFDTMVKSMRDPLLGAVIAQRTGEILTHIYVTTMTILAEANPGVVIRVEEIAATAKRVKKVVTFSGDQVYFKIHLETRGAKVLLVPELMDNGLFYAKIETDESGNGISRGIFNGRNGESINIRSIDISR